MRLLRSVLAASVGVAVMVLAPMTSASATPNPVQDGNFATPVTAPSFTEYCVASGTSTDCPVANPTFGPWTVTSASVDLNPNSLFPPPAGDPASTQTVDLDGSEPGAIAQTLTGLAPGRTYVGTFELGANPGGGDTAKNMEVLAGSDVVGAYTYPATAAHYGQSTGWLSETFTFVASPSGTATLTFASTDPAGPYPTAAYGPLVTDIVVTPFVAPQCTATPTGPSYIVTGNVPGSLSLSGGSWSVTNATVHGAIVIGAGTKVVITNSTLDSSITAGNGANVAVCGSTVKGALSATTTPTSVTVCTSTLAGAVTVKGSTQFVLIGDPFAHGCGTNTLTSGGATNLTSNVGGIEVSSNKITGTLNFNKNSGNPVVAGNTIGGSLNCAGNTPPPTNGGLPNTVAGTESGQCAGL